MVVCQIEPCLSAACQRVIMGLQRQFFTWPLQRNMNGESDIAGEVRVRGKVPSSSMFQMSIFKIFTRHRKGRENNRITFMYM